VDVIPPVIADELADLQDEVPPESLEHVSIAGTGAWSASGRYFR
jgi:hypothetical protein